jgi:hypothetical protein
MKQFDIARQPGAFLAVKRPVPVTVEFAEEEGVLDTREGEVRYQAGDALLSGIEGERWPVPRERFLESYDAVAPLSAGEGGAYVKRQKEVWAWRTGAAIEIALSDQRGILQANAGDVIVDYGGGDLAVVAASIFEGSYERAQEPHGPADGDTGAAAEWRRCGSQAKDWSG